MHHLKLSKNKAIIYTLALALTGTVAYATTPKANSELDLDGLNQQVQNHEERLNNHEARISNTENDVKEVQTATGVAPSANRTAVPPVTTAATTTTQPPSPTAEPTVPPVTITSYAAREDGNITWCDYSYSDGSSSSFKWKTRTINTDIKTGAVLSSETVSGVCNASAIGQLKA